jgi:hypothetical protein
LKGSNIEKENYYKYPVILPAAKRHPFGKGESKSAVCP